MVNQVKADLLMESPADEVDTNLPQVIVQMQPALASLPEAGPPRQVKIDPVDIRHLLFSQNSLNRLPVVCPSDNPDLTEPGDLLHPIPANAWLGALTRFTRIGRNEDF